MKLSTRARYALRMTLELARLGEGTTMSLGEIARRTSISRRYLDQLAIALKSAGLLTARAGRGGGYALARPAHAIHLGEVIEASIGPINIVDCVLQPGTCLKAEICECRAVYRLINHRVAEVFAAYTLHDLAAPGSLARLTGELAEPRKK